MKLKIPARKYIKKRVHRCRSLAWQDYWAHSSKCYYCHGNFECMRRAFFITESQNDIQKSLIKTGPSFRVRFCPSE